MAEPSNIYRIAVVGDKGTGKTAFCRRIAGKGFDLDCPPTQGIDFYQFKIKVDSPTQHLFEVKIQLWDSSISDKTLSTRKTLNGSCQGAIIMFDLNRPETYDNVLKWKTELLEINPEMPIVVYGSALNKEGPSIMGASSGDEYGILSATSGLGLAMPIFDLLPIITKNPEINIVKLKI